MSEQTDGQVRYVVQRYVEPTTSDSPEGHWEDVAKPLVAPRSRRRTILTEALGEKPLAGKYRVLDAESAEEIPVTLEDQPPKVVIG